MDITSNTNMTLEEKILERLSYAQVRYQGIYPRDGFYKDFCINDDDCPLFTYKMLEDLEEKTKLEFAIAVLKNNKLIEVSTGYDGEGKLCGKGFVLTQKGLEYVVDNNLVDETQ